jgi:hypothetical protein
MDSLMPSMSLKLLFDIFKLVNPYRQHTMSVMQKLKAKLSNQKPSTTGYDANKKANERVRNMAMTVIFVTLLFIVFTVCICLFE